MDRRQFLRGIGVLSCGTAGAAENVERVRGRRVAQDRSRGSQPQEPGRGAAASTVPADGENWDVAWRATPASSTTWISEDELRRYYWPNGLDLTHRDGRVVVAGPDVVTFDAEDGSRAWIDREVEARHAAVDDGLVVVESVAEDEPGQLVGLSLSSGERRWTVELDDQLETDPVIAGSAVFVPVDGDLVAYDRTDGMMTHRWGLSGETDLVVAEGIAYVTTDYKIAALDLETREQRWTNRFSTVHKLYGPRLDRTTGIVVAKKDTAVVQAVTTDGAKAWESFELLLTGHSSPLAVGNGYCVAVSVGGPDDDDAPTGSTLVCLDLETGLVEWRRTLPSTQDEIEPREVPVFAPTIVDGTVWAATRDVVEAIDVESGTLLRRWGLPDDTDASPVVTDTGIGFLDRSALYWLDPEGECADATDADVSVEYWLKAPTPGAKTVELEGTLGSADCAGLDTVELWIEGEQFALAGTHSPAGQRGALEFRRPADNEDTLPRDPDASIVVRDTAGTVVSERSVTVDDYRTGPGEFLIDCASVGAERASVGELVSVKTTVRNIGGFPAEYSLSLLVDGSPVTETTGSLSRHFTDLGSKCEGTERHLAHAFEEPGEYDLSVSITATGEGGSGESEELGTITVTDSDGGGWGTAALVGGTAFTAAAGGATYWWRSHANSEETE